MDNLIAGAGGKPSVNVTVVGRTNTPVTVRDNLDSRQYATIVDLISEGEIAGYPNGLQSIYLDNTPLQNPDGSYNFQNVTVETRSGTQVQSYIPLAPDTEREVSVGTELAYNTPVTRQITDPNINAVRITITVPQLQRFIYTGDIFGGIASIAIQVQYNGGGYNTVLQDDISGRTADPFSRDYIINLSPGFTTADIRVFRTTVPDETIVAESNGSITESVSKTFWTSYTEIVYAKLRYPNTALVAMRFDAEQFSSVPTRSYRVRGIKVRIPNNATVDGVTGRLIYGGIWNGTFGAAQWCSDPAWILFDLLTSKRYGFGDYIAEAQLDKWAFYSASQYASELVPDGFGDQEPRFSCNVNIQSPIEAYKLINDLCSVMRVMPFWGAGALTIKQDKPTDSSYLFTLANVTEAGFSYQGASRKTRPTVVVVSYLDLDTRDKNYETVEDPAGIAKYGVNKQEVEAFACTSRGQARRLGEWLIYSERYESEVINFTTSIDAGVVVRPGQVIEVSDPMRAGVRRGGRIKTATTTTITVDDATGLAGDASSRLSVILPNGTVETRAVYSIVGNTFTLFSGFSIAPSANSVWIYETGNIQASTWRVLSVAETDDGNQYNISALAYNASKYDYVERNVPLRQRDITDLNILPPAPVDLTGDEVLYDAGGIAKAKLLLTWRPVTGVAQYRIQWRRDNENWRSDTVASPDYEILDTIPGTYYIRVYSLSTALRPSAQPAQLTKATVGKTAPPAAVTGLSLIPIDDASAVISWDRSTELDVLLGGKVLIRHNVASTGALWEESQEIVSAAAGSQTQKQVPLLAGTYLVKFEDDGGRRSATAATAAVQLPAPQPRLLVQSYREDQETPPFSGNLTDMIYSTELDGLILATGDPVDSFATDGDWDALGTIDAVSGSAGSGEYEFGSTFDLGGVFDLDMRRYFVTRSYLPGNLIDDNASLLDSWPSFDGTLLDYVNAALYVRSTNDDPGASPTWTTWREFANAITRGRAFQFKAIATSTNSAQNIVIDELGCELELQQRSASDGPLTTTTAAYTVTFANRFYQTPQLGITAYNMATGDYYVINSPTRSGFSITFYNASNSMISRQFSYTAIGYGREIV